VKFKLDNKAGFIFKQKQSAYQNINFFLRLYVVQNKYIPHTINRRPPPHQGGATKFGNLWVRTTVGSREEISIWEKRFGVNVLMLLTLA
jgi:hypothetical protein